MADDICARHICLPLYYGMTGDEAGQVIEALRRALGHEPTISEAKAVAAVRP